QDPPPIGIASLADLTWKDRLDVQACTECARCEQACPASRTGKPLSPMLLVLDLRNQLLKAGGPPPLARTRRARGDESDAKGNVTADGHVDRTLVAPGALPVPTVDGNGTAAADEPVAASATPAAADEVLTPLQLVGEVIT